MLLSPRAERPQLSDIVPTPSPLCPTADAGHPTRSQARPLDGHTGSSPRGAHRPHPVPASRTRPEWCVCARFDRLTPPARPSSDPMWSSPRRTCAIRPTSVLHSHAASFRPSRSAGYALCSGGQRVSKLKCVSLNMSQSWPRAPARRTEANAATTDVPGPECHHVLSRRGHAREPALAPQAGRRESTLVQGVAVTAAPRAHSQSLVVPHLGDRQPVSVVQATKLWL